MSRDPARPPRRAETQTEPARTAPQHEIGRQAREELVYPWERWQVARGWRRTSWQQRERQSAMTTTTPTGRESSGPGPELSAGGRMGP